MNANSIKQCVCCHALVDSKWKTSDEKGHFICPYCDTVNSFNNDDYEEEINRIYYQLDNLQFITASNKLGELRIKYPNCSKVFFLSLLADNAVCYTEG